LGYVTKWDATRRWCPNGIRLRREARLAALRAELQRDVADADATDALTALIDALDGYQRRKPLRLPTR
jgi:hypothetical protein